MALSSSPESSTTGRLDAMRLVLTDSLGLTVSFSGFGVERFMIPLAFGVFTALKASSSSLLVSLMMEIFVDGLRLFCSVVAFFLLPGEDGMKPDELDAATGFLELDGVGFLVGV